MFATSETYDPALVMTVHPLAPLTAFTLCAAAAMATAACDPVYDVQGTVHDPAGAPIVGAAVTKSCPSGRTEHETTDAAGQFSFGGVGGSFEAGKCSLTIDAPGYTRLTLRTYDVCYQNSEDAPHRNWPCTAGKGVVTLRP
jgi:hypothetical protein